MAYQAPQQPTPGASIATMRDRLDWLSLEGTADALVQLKGPNPPRGHRAERRAYMTGYLHTLNAIRAYAEANAEVRIGAAR